MGLEEVVEECGTSPRPSPTLGEGEEILFPIPSPRVGEG